MTVRRATIDDVPHIVDLSEKKRTQYEQFQPLFWRKAKDSREKQTPFFTNMLQNEDMLMMVHEEAGGIDGFIIANLRQGRPCGVDDFAVADEIMWDTVGKALLQSAGTAAQKRGTTKYDVVCGHLDQPKRAMLHDMGLTIERYWYTAAINVDASHTFVVRKAVLADSVHIAQVAGHPERAFPEIERENTIVLVCENEGALLGYAIALVIQTPPVYDPGGPTCLVIESVVAKPDFWSTAGGALLNGIQNEALKQDAVQIVVICEAQNLAKQQALQDYGLTIASEWFVGKITPRT